MLFCWIFFFLCLSHFQAGEFHPGNRPADLAPVPLCLAVMWVNVGRAAPGPGERHLPCLWDPQKLLTARRSHPSTNWEQMPCHGGSTPDRQNCPGSCKHAASPPLHTSIISRAQTHGMPFLLLMEESCLQRSGEKALDSYGFSSSLTCSFVGCI